MRRWRRLAVASSAGATALCLGLILAPYLYGLASLALARWRWARQAGAGYRVAVTQLCNCYHTGEFELSVRGGQVVRVEPLDAAGPAGRLGAASRLDPARFNHLTVEAAFDRAARSQRFNLWPAGRRDRIEYDPVLGYVRRFESGDAGAPHFYYVYRAHDLQPELP
jgi:hypothetical protein